MFQSMTSVAEEPILSTLADAVHDHVGRRTALTDNARNRLICRTPVNGLIG
jgi:hypothetical protein